jgi:hypothetical protein
MALVECRARHPLDIGGGQMLAPGAQAQVDLDDERVASLVTEHQLLILDGSPPPVVPDQPQPVYAKGTRTIGYVPVSQGPFDPVEWRPISVDAGDLGFDVVPLDTFAAHEALTEDVHGIPADVPDGSAIRRTADGWEAFEPLAEASAYADAHLGGFAFPAPVDADDAKGFTWDKTAGARRRRGRSRRAAYR